MRDKRIRRWFGTQRRREKRRVPYPHARRQTGHAAVTVDLEAQTVTEVNPVAFTKSDVDIHIIRGGRDITIRVSLNYRVDTGSTKPEHVPTVLVSCSRDFPIQRNGNIMDAKLVIVPFGVTISIIENKTKQEIVVFFIFLFHLLRLLKCHFFSNTCNCQSIFKIFQQNVYIYSF